jgi:hypothetical protein
VAKWQRTSALLWASQFGAVPGESAASITVSVNTAHAVPITLNPAEPSEASDGRVVVYTTNDRIGFSVNGGLSFVSFNPASMYSDDPFGGADGDQVVQYVARVDRRHRQRQAGMAVPAADRARAASAAELQVRLAAIWNPGYAISYPCLNVSQDGHLGIALAAGGSGHWVNSAVADWTAAPCVGWYITSSNTSCQCNRYGDYLAIRPAYGTKSAFTATGYGTDKAGNNGRAYDPHFAQFTIVP